MRYWGTLGAVILAMEYAIRHPDRVSHMILMNTGVASHEDYLLLQQELSRRKAPYREELNALLASAAYKGGDPDAVAQYYRIISAQLSSNRTFLKD